MNYFKYTTLCFLMNLLFSYQVKGQPPTNGLVAKYYFEGNANDDSGNGNNGTAYGPVLTTDRFGIPNSAYTFDGVDDYIDIPTLGAYQTFSLVVWVKFTSTNLMNTFGGSGAGWYPSVSVGKTAWYDGVDWRFSNSQINDNNWHNIAYVFDNDTFSIFVDGISEYSGVLGSFTNGAITQIGRISAGQRVFNGSLDDIRIYDRALNQSEILAIVNESSTAICDWGCNGNHLFYTLGGVAIGTTDPGNYKLAVDGDIRARKIRVDQDTWPDYAFESGYQLNPLEKVEQYIQENGHLPEMISAKQVEKEGGIELGQIAHQQQLKIEEIFLHLIRMEKEIAVLKTQNERIKQENNVLKTLIEKVSFLQRELKALKFKN